MNPQDPIVDELMRSALARERRAQWREAIEDYLRVVRQAPRWALGYLCLGCALGKAGDHEAAAQVLSLGHDLEPRLLALGRQAGVDAEVAARSKYADALLRTVLTRLHARSVDDYEAQAGCGPLPRVRSAAWCQTHAAPVRYRHPQQRPWLLYLPDLPPRPWFEPAELPWSGALMARFRKIREEALAALEALQEQVAPYVSADAPAPAGLSALHGAASWSSLHLYREGVAAPHHVLAHLPETVRALAATDCVRHFGNPMEAVLSVLAPGTRIPPHFGLANTRLTVHLPLQVPTAGCRLTVAGASREPREGQLLAFDDSFRHEAVNDTAAVRIHLLFEAWRPELHRHEREALSRAMEDRARWTRERRLPELSGASA